MGNGSNGHYSHHQTASHSPSEVEMNGHGIAHSNGYGNDQSNEIEFELRGSVDCKFQKNGNEENESMCPCCNGVHNMDDNIGTHLTEISKLYNLKDSMDWKRFLLLPMHKTGQKEADEKDKNKQKENVLFNGFSNDKPLRLRIVSIRDDSVCLEWNCPEFDADKYQVYMKIADDK